MEEKIYKFNDFVCHVRLFCHDTPLIVSFAHLQGVIRKEEVSADNRPWAYNFIVKSGFNAVCFAPTSKNWYRSQELFKFVEVLSSKLADFKIKFGYGSSMGGYAVSAYADILGLTSILLLNPISTLDESLTLWDDRFKYFREKLDWSGPYKDGANTTATGYIVYDPMYLPDKLHAERYNEGLIKLKFPYIAHGVPYHLQELGVLKKIVISFIDQSLDCDYFYSQIRGRRFLKKYYRRMLSDDNQRLTNKRRYIIEAHLYKNINKPENLLEEINGVHLRLSKKDIDMLRDSALLLENKSLSHALYLMSLSLKARPTGDFIRNKVVDYTNKLDS